jgi:hypothetical protein
MKSETKPDHSNGLTSELDYHDYVTPQNRIPGHQCGFRRNTSTTDHIFYIRHILDKKWENNGAVHQLFIDFKKAYDSIRREVLYNILTEFEIPRKLAGLIKMCLNETYSAVRTGKNLSDKFLFRMA